MLYDTGMHDFFGLQFTNVHRRSSSSVKRAVFMYINYEYLYRGRSRALLSRLIPKMLSSKAKA